MANKRMLRLDVLDSDAFLDLPLSAQALYFHLNLRADDDGFISNPRRVVKIIDAKDDDLKLLIMKRFVLAFDDGVIVIKHWRMHNTIRKDRYTPTKYQDDLKLLGIKDNGAYTWQPDGNQLATTWQPDRNQLSPPDIGLDLDSGIDLDTNTSCSERSENRTEQEPLAPVEAIPLNDGTEWKPTLRQYEEYCRLYGNCDVTREFAKMRQWSNDNPRKKKTKHGVRRFVSGWLSREHDRNRNTPAVNNRRIIVNPGSVSSQVNINHDDQEYQQLFGGGK